MALSTLLLLKLGDQMLHPYIIQTATNCVALKATGDHTNPQKDAATNPTTEGTKNTVICAQEKQMLTELNNKCVKAILQTGIKFTVFIVFWYLYSCSCACHAGIHGSGGSAPHTHNLSTTVNGHEWSASCQATH